ncbi:MAG: hypothetical protein L6Q84_03590 [Polyangiaceae bacterium]|nr:hypothetical protein [Polyangiaceae bacterium]
MANIQKHNQLHKLAPFIRVGSSARFTVNPALENDLLRWLECYCREHDVRIEVIRPDGTRLALFTSAGVLIGAGFGYLVAGPPGAVVGAGVGAIAGYTVAHHRIVWNPSESELLLVV